MTTVETSKADILRAIDTETAWWRAVIDLAQERAPLNGSEPVDGSWTFKEVLAHVDGWRQWTLARLEAAASGEEPVAPWPAELPGETEEDVDEINAWFDEQVRPLPLNEVIDGFMRRLGRIRAAVEALSADDLLTPGRYARFGPEWADLPLGPAIVGYSISHVHDEHAPALIAWLSERLGQHAELPPAPSNFGFED